MLLYAPGDRFLQEMFIENEYPPPDAVYRVYEFLRGLDADPIELTHAEIKESARLDLNESAVGTALKILEGAGAVERFRPRENMAIVRINAEADEPSLVDRVSPNAHVQLIVLRGLEGLVNRRFGESVYFHPDDFAAKLGLDRTGPDPGPQEPGGRAADRLRPAVPGQRRPGHRPDRSGRATSRSTSRPSSQRKQREYDKLERMIKYAQSTECRRVVHPRLLRRRRRPTSAAAATTAAPAEARPRRPARPIDTEAGREVVLKVLSGVARAKGRFGKMVRPDAHRLELREDGQARA